MMQTPGTYDVMLSMTQIGGYAASDSLEKTATATIVVNTLKLREFRPHNTAPT